MMTDTEQCAFIDWVAAQNKAGWFYGSEKDALAAWRETFPEPTGYVRKNPWDVGVTFNGSVRPE